MSVIAMKSLLESGVHFGHQTRRWNPKMAPYIYTSRNGIHIIDLQKTSECIDVAYKALFDIAQQGGKVLFVGTKKQSQDPVREEAIRSGQYFVDKRWLGGTLTNFKTIKRSIRKLQDLYKMEEDGTFKLLPKKEVINKRKEMERLEKFLGGIKEMKSIPQALFIIDPRKERNAILEARILNIPVFGIVDTNCDPDDVDYIIPANDDALRSVKLIVSTMADAVIEANGGQSFDVEEDVEDEDTLIDDVEDEEEVVAPVKKVAKPAPAKKEAPVAAKPVQKEAPVVKAEPVKEEVKAPVKEEVAAPVVEAKVEVDYTSKTVAELREVAKELGITGYSKLKKAELIDEIKKVA